MDRQRVSSSNLHSVGYDPETMTLEIKFHSGGIYQYFNVPIQKVQGLLGAASKGGYFASNIKGVYRYRKVG